MVTVQTEDPDKVAPNEYGMLEQLSFGLTDNDVVFFADNAHAKHLACSLLHISLASSYSVKVEEGKKMYYVWMDFFLDKKGEEWLKTHNAIKKP